MCQMFHKLSQFLFQNMPIFSGYHFVKSVQIRSFSGPYFPVFGPKKLRIWTLSTQCVLPSFQACKEQKRQEKRYFTDGYTIFLYNNFSNSEIV